MITGATGFIGSHIAAELLKQGYSLTTIARPQGPFSARARVEQILAWLGVDPTDFTRIQVLEGYLDRPGLGLSKPLYEDLVANLDEIIHCASSTSFTERKRKEVEAANIQGLQNILELAVGGHCYFWHHMSTAYVAGKREGLCREEIAETARYTNVYEETKYWGERMVADFCTRHGIRFNIFRPSIVYGHSGNGRSSIFRGLYYPVRVVAYLKSLYEADIRENGGQRAAAMGVRSTADGSIYLPLRLEVNENGGINLIPIDYLVRAFMAIMEESLEGGIFHMVSPNPQKIFALIDYTQRFFQIEGIGFSSANDSQPGEENPLAVLFDRYLEAYTPYIRDRRLFDDRNARAILESKRILCPEFTYEIFARIMKFAVECNWGAKLFLPPPNPEV